MTEMILLSEAQMARISPFFPLSHGMPRVDDRRVISGIIFVIRNGLRWRDVPPIYGPHKTIYNRFVRWSEMGVFGRIFVELAKGGGDTEEIMIDATHLKAHRTAASLLKKGLFPGSSDSPITPPVPLAVIMRNQNTAKSFGALTLQLPRSLASFYSTPSNLQRTALTVA